MAWDGGQEEKGEGGKGMKARGTTRGRERARVGRAVTGGAVLRTWTRDGLVTGFPFGNSLRSTWFEAKEVMAHGSVIFFRVTLPFDSIDELP